jgi:hypothetical protein
MKIALTILSTVALLGCSQENARPLLGAPDLPAINDAWLWGMVVHDSGSCIVGATVSVVRGQALGRSIVQSTPCDAWAYSGGFEFKNLTPGVEMTLRTSAPGYAPKEVTVVPTSGAQMALLIEPTRLP